MTFSRRGLLGAGLGAMVLGSAARAETSAVRNNISSFRAQDWRDHFDTLGKATIVADTTSRAPHFWGADGAAYIIHGTHDTRKIGRRSSDGCIGLFNENIAELFDLCPVGTQVRVI